MILWGITKVSSVLSQYENGALLRSVVFLASMKMGHY
uniref:Uncharacterized protein n=1 Tax=Anguilla anguilla TaxID=7936 RepID=A0A0E9VG96_ANGAN